MTSGYFLAGNMAMGSRFFDPLNLNSSPIGMSGSEISFFRISREMSRLGHDVRVYCHLTRSAEINGVKYLPLSDLSFNDVPDYVYSWCDPMLAKDAPSHTLRICNQQINDFSYLPPDYDNFVDVWTSPSQTHMKKVGGMSTNPTKWRVVNNGCDHHQMGDKIPSRVMWSSSPDRGLHWLLSIWPEVRRQVPHAELKIFYSVRRWIDNFIHSDHNSPSVFSNLMYRRAVYIDACLNRMKEGFGIELVDQVSRDRIEREYSQSEILAYPCDPISFTEGFSVSILDACSFGCVPLISTADALDELYCHSVPHVKMPINIGEYQSSLIRLLTDSSYLSQYKKKSWELSHNFTWENSARQFLGVLKERGIE